MIDIIIPVFNAPDLLRKCVTAIRANTLLSPSNWRIAVAYEKDSDGPTKDLIAQMQLDGWVGKFCNSGQRGFPHNCNQAVRNLDGEYICLLNSDVAVRRGWLVPMLAQMEDSEVAVVGAKLIYPRDKPNVGGTIQHAGVFTRPNGLPDHAWRGKPANLPEANVRLEVNCVTFALALIRRSVWEELGGLDEAFVGGQFEDVDFCRRVREAGYKVIYQPQAVAYHWEHGSGEEFVLQTEMRNRNLLLKRWPDYPPDEHIFRPFNWDLIHAPPAIDAMAVLIHQVRAEAMLYVTNKIGAGGRGRLAADEREHLAHSERLAVMSYHLLPGVEQDWAKERARRFADMICKVRED